MNEQDLLYGSHSAIQKAVRRSDLNLAKTAFDAMWAEKEHRNWLKWRTTILAEEDCWQMLGEVAKFYSTKPGDDEKAWRRMIYTLCLVDKSKDPEPLSTLAGIHLDNKSLKEQAKHPEMKVMLQFLKKMKPGDPSSITDELMKWCEGYRELSPYELKAVRLAKSRVNQGGMLADRVACLGAMILITMRGLDEEKITEHVQMAIRERLTEKPKTIPLPWYVFDTHTQVGQMALGVFMKRYAGKYHAKMTRTIVDNIWFFHESAVHEFVNLMPFDKDAKPTCFDSIWWVPLIKVWTAFGDQTPKQAKEHWQNGIRSEIEKLVIWALEKRDQKD